MTTWASGGVCMSRSNLRLAASEDESDALFGKGSGSSGDLCGDGLGGTDLVGIDFGRRRLCVSGG
jgi:hypothetical protein